MRHIAIILIIFFISGCAALSWQNYYPYCKLDPSTFYQNLPEHFDDCLVQFDSILSDKVVNHFKNLDSSMAYIEISQEIGALFINSWNLKIYSQKKSDVNYSLLGSGYGLEVKRYYNAHFVDDFFDNGIKDPQEMIRILFSAYHKKLNNQPYDWDSEIQKIKLYWVPSRIRSEELSPEVRKIERNILISHHYNALAVNDTIDVLYNSAPRLLSNEPDWYYLSGIIQNKLDSTMELKIKLINIQSEFDKDFIPTIYGNKKVGDTLTDYSRGWLKRGVYYLNYRSNKEYREGFNNLQFK